MQRASKPWRIASVPMTVMGLPSEPRAGRKPVASPVEVMDGDRSFGGHGRMSLEEGKEDCGDKIEVTFYVLYH